MIGNFSYYSPPFSRFEADDFDPYSDFEEQYGPRPSSFKELPEEYRRAIRGQALAALGAGIGAAGPGRVGAGMAAGVADYGQIMSNALLQGASDYDQRADAFARQELRREQVNASRRDAFEQSVSRYFENRGRSDRRDSLMQMIEDSPLPQDEKQEWARRATFAQTPEDADQVTKDFSSRRRQYDQEERERIEGELRTSRNAQRLGVSAEQYGDVAEADNTIQPFLMRALGIRDPERSAAPHFTTGTTAHGTTEVIALDRDTGDKLWSYDTGKQEPDPATNMAIRDWFRLQDPNNMMMRAVAASMVEGNSSFKEPDTSPEAFKKHLEDYRRTYDLAQGKDPDEFEGSGAVTGGEPAPLPSSASSSLNENALAEARRVSARLSQAQPGIDHSERIVDALIAEGEISRSQRDMYLRALRSQ